MRPVARAAKAMQLSEGYHNLLELWFAQGRRGVRLMRVVAFGFQTWGFTTRQALIDRGQVVAPALTRPAGEPSCRATFSQLARDHGSPGHLNERVDTATIDLVDRVPRTQSSSAVMNSPCAADI